MFVWTALNKKMKFFNHKIILQSILWRIFMKFSNKSFDGFWYCWKIWFLLTLFWIIERLVSSFKSLHSFYSHSKSMKLSFDEKSHLTYFYGQHNFIQHSVIWKTEDFVWKNQYQIKNHQSCLNFSIILKRSLTK